MNRGLVIFGAGVGVGYVLAMSRQEPNGKVKEALAESLRAAKAVANDAYLDSKNQAKNTPYCPYCGAAEEPDGHGKAHADECPIVLNAKPTTEVVPKGENPS